ncbi:MAG: hypothetical protein WBA13_03880 [Microcoleaceae cyanobacterium]
MLIVPFVRLDETMSENNVDFDLETLQSELELLQQKISAIASGAQGNGVALLKILRTLESSHRQIREGLFQEVLPQNRQQLYHLLKEIETEGGWPYIPRARLQSVLAKMNQESD